MEPEETSLPGNRWRLTAPESCVLFYGPRVGGGQALKLALLELVARGWLELTEVEERSMFRRVRNVAVLQYGSGRQGPGGSPLDAVLELFRSLSHQQASAGGSGVPVDDFAWAARKRYDPLGGYAKAEVLPSLARRGLYERNESRFLGIFRTTRWEPTRAGSEAWTELELNMALGEERFGEWVDTDPARALAFLGATGSSVLLMNPLHPDIRRLHQRRRTEGGYAGGIGVYPVGVGSSDDPETGLEDLSGAFDPGAFDFDLGVFDGLDSASSAIDSGVDSGGGGGDGGGGWGGDGGGGWGGGDGGGGGGGG